MTFVLVRQIDSLNHMLWEKNKIIKGFKLSWHSSNPFNQSLETNCAYKNVKLFIFLIYNFIFLPKFSSFSQGRINKCNQVGHTNNLSLISNPKKNQSRCSPNQIAKVGAQLGPSNQKVRVLKINPPINWNLLLHAHHTSCDHNEIIHKRKKKKIHAL